MGGGWVGTSASRQAHLSCRSAGRRHVSLRPVLCTRQLLLIRRFGVVSSDLMEIRGTLPGMASVIRAQVALQAATGLPEDVTVNTFHFETPVGDEVAGAVAVEPSLVAFYTGDPDGAGAGVNLSSFMSTEVAQNGHTIKFYDMADATPRVPIHEASFNLAAAPNGDPLPGEVACVLSFQGDKVSGLSQARRRGRIYLGRLDKDSSTAGRPSASLITSLTEAGRALLLASQAAVSWSWIVYSAAFDGTTKDENGAVVPHPTRAAYPATYTYVTSGWVDNAFDTQRRRGLAATTRTTFTA